MSDAKKARTIGGSIFILIAFAVYLLAQSSGGNHSSGGGAVWGLITGTLSSQADLQSALNAKASSTTAVVATSPGVGIAHFAGATQTVTSSPIVAADITNATITGTQLAASLALTGTPTVPTAAVATNTTQAASTAFVASEVIAPGAFWVTNPGNSANVAGFFSATVNTAQVSSWTIPFTKTSTRVCYFLGTTADNTAATYDIGLYTGASAGIGTLLADTGPIAGTTFAPGTTAYHCLNWAQGTVTIPGGLIHIAFSTSQTVTPATLTGSPFGGFVATPTSEAVTTGGTLPGTITLPPVSNSGAGSAGNNGPWLSIQ